MEGVSSMSAGPIKRIRPDLEGLEVRQPLSAGPSRALLAHVHQQPAPVKGITMERITNPTPFNARLKPPFDQVRVQSRSPVPGEIYNVVFISLRNSTARTFDAS